jgi:hypothetical protein
MTLVKKIITISRFLGEKKTLGQAFNSPGAIVVYLMYSYNAILVLTHIREAYVGEFQVRAKPEKSRFIWLK